MAKSQPATHQDGRPSLSVLDGSSAQAQGGAIAISNVTKVFKTKDGEVRALDNVSFDISAGEFVSIVGPSGCGKSTLLSIVAGLKSPSGGAVVIDGRPITKAFTDAGIVFQRDLLMEWRTALDNVLLQIEMRGLKTKDYMAEAKRLLASVGLSEFENKYPRELSGGMRQRVSICRALIHNPPVILMDEPFGALDALTRDEIALDLSRLATAARKTVVFITHSIAEAVYLSDRVVVMSARPGQILDIVDINLPRPRGIAVRDTPDFGRFTHRIRAHLMGTENPGARSNRVSL